MLRSRSRQLPPKRHRTFQTITRIDVTYSGVLPQADQIALGVVEIRAETHVADRVAADRDLAAELLDPGQRVVEVVDADRDDRRGDRALPGEHAAVDPADLGGLSLLVGRRRADQRVLETRHRVELPPERLAIERRGPLAVVERHLEVDDL